MSVKVTPVSGTDLVRIEVKTEGRTKMIYRRKGSEEHREASRVSKISSKNPFSPQSLAIPAEQVKDFQYHTGVTFEPTDNGFAVPKFTSMNQWYGYLKATGRHDRDGYR
jgi:hypothetical protein